MVMEVICVKRSSGEYEGRAYDNTLVYGFVRNSQNKQILCGDEVEMCKFKTSAFAEALERNINAVDNSDFKDVKGLLGLLIKPEYNKFGSCEDFFVQPLPSGNKK